MIKILIKNQTWAVILELASLGILGINTSYILANQLISFIPIKLINYKKRTYLWSLYKQFVIAVIN